MLFVCDVMNDDMRHRSNILSIAFSRALYNIVIVVTSFDEEYFIVLFRYVLNFGLYYKVCTRFRTLSDDIETRHLSATILQV